WFIEKTQQAVGIALPGVGRVMSFARELAEILAAQENVLWWRSPSGVPVYNKYSQPDPYVKTTYLGATPIRHKVGAEYKPEVDRGRCVRGAPPNLIHSLDASHLAFVALACECARIPLATVHDCFGTLACHVDALREILCRELVAMYETKTCCNNSVIMPVTTW